MVIANSILSSNYVNTAESGEMIVEDDCDGADRPVNGVNGNLTGPNAFLTFPGYPAVCGGLLANIPQGITTDQRGLPRTTVYSTPSAT